MGDVSEAAACKLRELNPLNPSMIPPFSIRRDLSRKQRVYGYKELGSSGCCNFERGSLATDDL